MTYQAMTIAGLVLGVALTLRPALAQSPQYIAGNMPLAGVVQASDGSIFGTTYYWGGADKCGSYGYEFGCGTVFRLDPSGTAASIYAFDGKSGAGPGPLGVGSGGNLYGVAHSLVFSLTVAGKFKKIGKLCRPG
jgi:hypothetical protein